MWSEDNLFSKARETNKIIIDQGLDSWLSETSVDLCSSGFKWLATGLGNIG